MFPWDTRVVMFSFRSFSYVGPCDCVFKMIKESVNVVENLKFRMSKENKYKAGG